MSVPKVALITGCSEPISMGAALALDLRKNGYRVFATARNWDGKGSEALKVAGCDILTLDVQSVESVEAAAKAVEEQAGRLDLLINNAGVSTLLPALDSDLTKVAEMLDINALGPVRVIQAFAGLMIKTANDPALAKDDGHSVSIMNVGSGARTGFPFQLAYGGSKAALFGMTEALRHELSAFGILVSYVNLRSVNTAMSTGAKEFDTKLAKPSEFYTNWEQINAKKNEMMGGIKEKAGNAQQAAQEILKEFYQNRYPAMIDAGYAIPVDPNESVDEVRRRMFAVDVTIKPTY